MNSVRNLVNSLVLICISVAFCLVAAEIMLRVIDGYQITSASLASRREPESSDRPEEFVQSVLARARRYAADIKIDPGFKLEWFDANPPALTDRTPTFPLPADWEKAVERMEGRDQRELSFWYNYNFIKPLCEVHLDYEEFAKFKKDPGFVYTFDPPDETGYPEYRFVPRGWDRGAKSINNFGFLGPDIPYPKPPKTIRIAFLGYSTTMMGDPWTYPDFIGQMLREWAHGQGLDVDFDVINAGRVGVGSTGMARIMRYEIAPLQPDLVIFYTGGYNVSFAGFNSIEMQPQTFSLPPLTHYSALAVRLSELTAHRQGAGSEPTKPAHKLKFDFSQDVDFDRVDLPFRLHQELADMREILKYRGGSGPKCSWRRPSCSCRTECD